MSRAREVFGMTFKHHSASVSGGLGLDWKGRGWDWDSCAAAGVSESLPGVLFLATTRHSSCFFKRFVGDASSMTQHQRKWSIGLPHPRQALNYLTVFQKIRPGSTTHQQNSTRPLLAPRLS